VSDGTAAGQLFRVPLKDPQTHIAAGLDQVVMLTRATLLSGQWPVDKMRPLMADMQTARLGVDHSDARRRTGRKSLVGCADLE
jgi:hypothetical protein